MKEELLHIGPFTIYGYGLMIAIGVISCYLVMEYRAKKLGMKEEKILGLVICCLLGGFLGAKVLYFITEFQEILQDPGILLNLSDGFVVYGGILGGILSGCLYCRFQKLNFLEYFDLAMPSVALAQGFGRIGCLLAGCCYGVETDSVFGITFQNSSFAPNGVSLFPTQIFSSVLDFLHFFLLLWIAKHKTAQGQVAGFYLIFYSLGRFLLEFFRGDLIRGSVGVLSTSQFISIFTFLGGCLLVWLCTRKRAVSS